MPRSSPRSVEQLVEHQIKRWEVEHRATVPRPGAPCVAFSRLPGSGAEDIAHQVADWLDYGFFGSQIVDQIAKEQSIQLELVAGLDEQVRGAIQRFVVDSFRSSSFTESDYLREVVRVLTTLGERGMAVVLGRGAAWVMPSKRTLRVLVAAPLPARAERLAKRHEIPIAEARDRVEHEDHLRREFVRIQFGLDPDDPALYDLVVNTEHFGVEAASRVIVEALRRRFPATG